MRITLCAAVASIIASAAFGDIRLQGYWLGKNSQTPRFALFDNEARASCWVGPGESFSGWTVVTFDANTRSLVVRKNEETRSLPLVGIDIKELAAYSSAANLDRLEGMELVYAIAAKDERFAQSVLQFCQRTPRIFDDLQKRVALAKADLESTPSDENRQKLNAAVGLLQTAEKDYAVAMQQMGIAAEKLRDTLRAGSQKSQKP